MGGTPKSHPKLDHLIPVVWGIPCFQKAIETIEATISSSLDDPPCNRPNTHTQIGQFISRVRTRGGMVLALVAPATDLLALGWIDILNTNYTSLGKMATHPRMGQTHVPHLILNIEAYTYNPSLMVKSGFSSLFLMH